MTSANNHLLVGGYGTDIRCLAYDAAGTLAPVASIPIEAPSYVAYDAARGVVYAVVEKPAGGVGSAFFRPADGASEVTSATSSGGADPCHLVLSPDGTRLFVANYSSGSVAAFTVAGDGRVTDAGPAQLIEHQGSGPRADRQEGPHAHQVALSPDGRFVLAVDLGTDSVVSYRIGGAGEAPLAEVSAMALKPGTGPRHLAFHGSGRYAYLLTELASTIVVCGYDAATGTLTPGTEVSSRAPEAAPDSPNWPAAIRVSADDRFVYATNREDDTITVFAVGDGGAALELRQVVAAGGAWPRDIVLSPDGTLLFSANQKSDSVTVFRVDAGSGELTAAGEPYAVPTPSAVLPI